MKVKGGSDVGRKEEMRIFYTSDSPADLSPHSYRRLADSRH